MLVLAVGYSRDIHRIFMGYTYVSGMCRVCIERNRVQVGYSNFMQDNLHNEYIINNLNNIYFQQLAPQSTTWGATQGIEQPRMARIGTDEHGNAGDGSNDNGDNLALASTSSSATQRMN